jgi:hypothetical protein
LAFTLVLVPGVIAGGAHTAAGAAGGSGRTGSKLKTADLDERARGAR